MSKLRLHKLADRTEQVGVTIRTDEDGEPLFRGDGTPITRPVWKFAGMTLDGPPPDRVKLTTRLVDQGLREGWISLGQGLLILNLVDGNVTYEIKRNPGRYCCFCDKNLGGIVNPSPSEDLAALKHIEAEHPDSKSPDANNPSGYCLDRVWVLERTGATKKTLKKKTKAKGGV